ncbi:MAG: glycosyltransferase family 2 protein [Verrucomicrobia bacterium]|nr:glycosyltransferase family 2 protein [Verrucomicrobiota bacterium]
MMARDFKIHCICVVKNEGDVIRAGLQAASEWADRIIVYDGQSDDNTWEVVCSMAGEKIIPWKQDGKVFQESLRAEVFNAFRAGSRPGDWWCHLDADEFYVENPRQFLSRVPWPYHVVWGIAVEFYLTEKDVDPDYRLRPEVPEAELGRLNYYSVDNSEPRFFRDRRRLVWPSDTGWPLNMGPVYPKRLLYKHYKYRSPEQTQLRLQTRLKSVAGGFTGWEHARTADWREKLHLSGSLKKHGFGRFEYDAGKLPKHLDPLIKRSAKLFLHGLGVLP